MERSNDFFKAGILIQGVAFPVCFTFRMMYGEYGMEYKIRTSNPACDFNMSCNQTSTSKPVSYRLSDNKDLPLWLSKDKNLQEKLSTSIVNSLL